MEPILIYGVPAGSSMGLVAALEWLGQPYRLSRVDMLGEMREPSYARVNARHETPVLITDEGRCLTETMAIAAWLEARDSDRRISYPLGTAAADRMHQMAAFINTSFTGAFGPLWAALEMQPPEPATQTALRQFGRDAVIKHHDQLEAMLTPGDRYVAGDRPSLADALLIGVARWLEVLQVAERTRWPRLNALRSRLKDDAAVRFALAVENGETADGNGAFQGHVPLEDVITQFGAASGVNPSASKP
ncbi:glutathione S-transferase family protein [Ottowia sp. GY511]|uniref:Glutathione S-transferase family protein n=1 Tax=Ottowia flava TaxID=2675430 RepID=A0ABW4KXB5_9BURK|nr:glutathione S-transferase family protein [Ottowia sp. GY511]TXK31451.1 glutathione S-transferase family protein [Ottowia sp. GY511]